MGNSNSGSILHEKISFEYLLGIFGLASAFSTALSLLSVSPLGRNSFPGGGVLHSLPFSWFLGFS
mgnify:CR=1 FL=1